MNTTTDWPKVFLWFPLFLAACIPAFFFPQFATLFIALFLFLHASLIYRKSLIKWHASTGIVTKSGIASHQVAFPAPKAPEIYHFPQIEFSYTVNNSNYSSSDYALDKNSIWSKEKSEVESLLSTIQVGKPINIYINENNPTNAVVNPSISQARLSHCHVVFLAGILALFFWAFLYATLYS